MHAQPASAVSFSPLPSSAFSAASEEEAEEEEDMSLVLVLVLGRGVSFLGRGGTMVNDAAESQKAFSSKQKLHFSPTRKKKGEHNT